MKRYWIFYIIIGSVFINAIFFFDAFKGDVVDQESAGRLGDFVGGYIGTYFLFLSVLLLYQTLSSQKDANYIQGFESKYFELIKIHRANAHDLTLKTARGPKVFVLLIREYREILKITKQVAIDCEAHLPLEKLREVAYYCLFYGTGPNSSRQLKTSLNRFNLQFIEQLEKRLNQPEEKSTVQSDRKFAYTPFEGHQSRLGHYFRHLYQTVCYVDKQPISDKVKYEYLKTLRAQLSTHEQALLLLNSLTPLGSKWISNNFLNKYKLVKNIPLEFFDKETELNVHEIFANGYFEGEESFGS